MYKKVLRPLMFLLPPESIHKLIVTILKFGFKLPFVAPLIKKIYAFQNPKLVTEFCGLRFDNPIGFAAGFDKNAEVYNEFANFGFSFIEIGTVTPKAQPGNPKPRSFRIPKDQGLINRMGFNNKGVDYAVNQLKKRQPKLIIGGNIGKNTATSNDDALTDYVYCFTQLYDYVDYLVVNVSCPNISNLTKLQDKTELKVIIEALLKLKSDKEIKKPILLKVSPDLNNQQLDDVIDLFFETGIDGLVATNTSVSRENLISPKKKIEKIANGGLSGKPIAKRSTEVIRYITEKSGGKIPIMGVGGIMSVEDAIEKINAGAGLIQLYTGFIYNGPAFVKRINKALVAQKTIQNN